MLRLDAKLLGSCFSLGLLLAATALAQGPLVFPTPSTCSNLTGTTDPCTLLPAAVGTPYSQNLSVSGGTPPYTWTVVSQQQPLNQLGLTLNQSTGLLSGTNVTSFSGNTEFQVLVTDSGSPTPLSASHNFLLNVSSGLSSRARTSVFPQVAAGAGWGTTIYLSNATGLVASAQVAFRDANANSMAVPVQSAQPGFPAMTTTAATLYYVMPAYSTVVIQNTNSASSTLLQGWADVLTTSGVSAFEVFRQSFAPGVLAAFPNGGFTEGVVAQQGQFSSTVTLPYDNTGGLVTAVALASISNLPPQVTATVYDINGTATVYTVPPAGGSLVTLGRIAFTLPDNYPASANTRGFVVFQNMNNVNNQGTLSGLALNFNSGVFVSFPPLQNATTQ